MAEIQIGGVSLASESGGVVTLDSGIDIKGNLNATGSAPVYACRAWVNFNGTGTVAIRASGNASSITDHSGGNYTINITTALPDTNYAVTGTASEAENNARTVNLSLDNYSAAVTTTTFRINTRNFSTGADVDCPIINVSVLR